MVVVKGHDTKSITNKFRVFFCSFIFIYLFSYCWRIFGMAASPMNDSACELLKVSATKLALQLSFFFRLFNLFNIYFSV